MTQRQRNRQRRRAGKNGKVGFVVVTIAAALAVGAVGVTTWVLDVAAEAPPLSDCRPLDRSGNSLLIAGDGSTLGYIASSEAHHPVPFKRVPRSLQYATVAIEDERFFDHDGIDYEGGLRALIENVEAGRVVQGGSTITMQLMRNLCITDPKRNLERKIQEAQLALRYEERHGKREILDRYLNSASYGTVNGATAVGVQAASRIFFSRPVWKLTLEQSALLAGLPQAPSDYNPILNPRGALARRNAVLSRMAGLGYISRARALEAQQSNLQVKLSDTYFERRQPYFFDYVQDTLIDRYGVNTVRKGGLRVYTTVEPDLQESGESAIDSNLPYPTDPSSALVAIDPRNGEIKAMVSSSSYDESKFNLAAQGHRQPGSTFKTFVLTTAIKQGIDPYSTYYTSKPLNLDLPRWGEWEVATYSNSYSGSMSIHKATLASDNTVFAQLDLDVGPEKVAQTAKAMGITTTLDGFPAEGLGGLRIGVSPLEMANAYATLASGGVQRDPVAIRRVVFPSGRVDRPERADPTRVLSPAVAYEVSRIMRDNITGGTGTAAYTGCGGQGGKTGTTDDYTDAWFAGFQPNLSTAVWVGYPQSNAISMNSVHGVTVAGGTFPAQIWSSFYAGAGVPCEELDVPEQQISWAPFFGTYGSAAPSDRGDEDEDDEAENGDRDRDEDGGRENNGYDPDLYAPGAGQAPAPAPAPPPPASGGGGDIDGASPTGGAGVQ